MNCRPGDLAVIVRSAANNLGRIVTCVRLATQSELDAVWFENREGPVWVIDRDLRTTGGEFLRLAPDLRLRPLRHPGDDARDETLSWKQVPKTDDDYLLEAAIAQFEEKLRRQYG